MSSLSLNYWFYGHLALTLVITLIAQAVQRRQDTVTRVVTFICGVLMIGMSGFVGYLAMRPTSPNSGVVAFSIIVALLGAQCVKEALSRKSKKK